MRVGPGEAVRDRHPHVRRTELGDQGAIAILDDAVNDGLRMDDDVDLLGGKAEQMVRLDQFQPLVHHGRGIDRDLGTHRPVGMAQRLLHGGGAHLIERAVRNGSAGGGQDDAAHIVARPADSA